MHFDSIEFLSSAVRLAGAACGQTSPNPVVGCILTDPIGKVIGDGHTQPAGGPHAEIVALRDAVSRGNSTVGATAYVTLEPCAHYGRTGPCCDALIAAGVTKVVATNTDPNPLVCGQGFARLRAAGVEVEVIDATDPLALAARELNIGFFSRMIRKTPWVRLKVAASLDGTTALANGVSQWITSPEARADGHAWRAKAGAILTGSGTVLQDQPRLDVRLAPTTRQPDLVIVDSKLKTPPNAPFFIAGRAVFIYAAAENIAKAQSLTDNGATVIYLPGVLPDGSPTGKVDLAAMMHDLAQREFNDLHVEGGHQLNGSLIREGLVDDLVIYLAPKLLGQGAPMAALKDYVRIEDGPDLTFKSIDMLGPDIRIVARISGRDRF